MHRRLHKKSILKKTAQVGASLLLSKFLGIAREVLQVKYLGVGQLSDAFNIAYRIPNMLRKIFAEGALSAALIPTLVKVMRKENEEQASKLITLTQLVIGTLLLGLCFLVTLYPQLIILLFAPGFVQSAVQFNTAVNLIRILIFFIVLIFSSALLASAMQAKHHFAVPSWGPALLNVVYIAGLLIAMKFGLPVEQFAYFLLGAGLVQLIVYFIVYRQLQFHFLFPDKQTFIYFKEVMIKFLPALITVSGVELSFLIDARFASRLPPGAITLLSLSSRFMTIALGAFAVAFSTILLPHFSRISTYAPKRLSFYLLESAKFILWVTAPIAILMSFFASDIFYTIFFQLARNFTIAQVHEAALLLQGFLLGLFFLSLNKAILSMYYSLHETLIPTIITFIGAGINFLLNRMLVPVLGVVGIAIATSLAAALQTLLFVFILNKKFRFTLYGQNFFLFILRYGLQLLVVFSIFYGIYRALYALIQIYLPSHFEFLVHSIGLWLWVGPLVLGLYGVLYFSRKRFYILNHFLG